MPPEQETSDATKPNSIQKGREETESSNAALRVCCYGSSSKHTPQRYMEEAYSLGFTLAKKGHTCVNGAGAYGCMAAMTEGATDGDGRVVGVIHEMFIVDGNDWYSDEDKKLMGGISQEGGEKKEIIIARGNDLQERKRLLVAGADALVVLPGGPGTWDELWEMACARNLGIIDLPIVCVNVDGYYDAFLTILQRAYNDRLVMSKPEDIIHFEPTSSKAVQWLEKEVAQKQSAPKNKNHDTKVKIRKKTSIFKKAESMFNWPPFPNLYSWSSSSLDDEDIIIKKRIYYIYPFALTFMAGLTIGAAAISKIVKTQ